MHQDSNLAVCDVTRLDRIFSPLDQCRLPGAAVAIAIAGVPVYRRGFGLANMELPVVLTPSTRMRIGSTTKQFAALAFMLLCEQGRADLDAPIGEYLPELHPVSRRVTLRALMGHTSGLRDVFQISMLANGLGRVISDAELLECYRSIDDSDFPPGQGWCYNNGGYLLLTAVIERITGRCLDDVLAEEIFQPLGMFDTRLRRWDTDFLANSAALHMPDSRGGYRKATMGMELTGAGGIVSTMDDMLRWLRHMDRPRIGSAQTWKGMTTPQRLENGAFTSYGFGLVPDSYRGVQTLSHAGGVIGGNSQMIKVPSAGLDIAIAVNRADANSIDLAFQVIDACVPGLDAIPDGNAESLVCGIFRSAHTGRVIELSAHGATCFISVDAGTPMGLVPMAHGTWQLAPMFSFLRQTVRTQGTTLWFSEFGYEDTLERIEPPKAAKLGTCAGHYRSDALAVSAHVTETDVGAHLRTVGRFGEADYTLTSLCANVWQAKSLDPLSPLAGVLTFAADGTGLTLNAERLRGAQLRRVS